MNRTIIIAAITLSACTPSPSSVRITNNVPQAPIVAAPKAMKAARSEPVFYNGKTYKLNMSPNNAGTYDVAVIGMSPGQAKDAKAFTSTAFHHFNCKDSQRTRFIAPPTFDGTAWRSEASCS
jgi:hypothetical protein